MYQMYRFPDRDALDGRFAEQVADILREAIARRGEASLAVSGGSTPKGFFTALSEQTLDWQKVTITLVDDRWLPEDHQDSNAGLVRDALLKNNAARARFISLVNEQASPADALGSLELRLTELTLPLDVAVLGMGQDGHTASLFPCCEELEQAMTTEAPLAFTRPKTAPYERITFSFRELLNARHLFLHITGDAKLSVMEQAVAAADGRAKPIAAFLTHPSVNVDVLWAP